MQGALEEGTSIELLWSFSLFYTLDCLSHLSHSLRFELYRSQALKPGISRAPWEAHEDQYVIQARESGEAWPAIASLLPGRIAEQIRERYINHLDPQLIRTPWTEQETFVLYEAQKRMGNKWCSISELLPGRSENSVKNRWHNAKMMQRRAMRRLITTKAREDHLERAKSHSVTSNMDGATPSRSPSSESEDEYSASV